MSGTTKGGLILLVITPLLGAAAQIPSPGTAESHLVGTVEPRNHFLSQNLEFSAVFNL